jgi:sarcosine oxidase
VPSHFDVVIVGLGAMGSAAAFHLSKRGLRVLGLDRFTPPHTFGSSHGQTRIIREAYFEHPIYVPLVQRAYVLWHELARLAGQDLFLQTGGLMIGPPQGVLVTGAQRSADLHGLPCQRLDGGEVGQRFPALQPAPEMVAVWEPRAGVLFPERCVSVHLSLARAAGAALRFDEAVLGWETRGPGVRVWTGQDSYSASHLVLSAGSWIQSLLPDWPLPVQVERQVLFWFEPADAVTVRPQRCPIHLWEPAPGRFFYGFPDLGEGVKLARHHEGERTTPDAVRREVNPDEIAEMRDLARRFVPGAGEICRSTAVCLYTNTPDEHFLIDWHPACPQVLVVSPCSGHGFKFSSVIGEIVSDLLVRGEPPFDLSLFRRRGF